MRLREGLRSNRRCDVSVLARIMEDYAFLCIYASRRSALNSADEHAQTSVRTWRSPLPRLAGDHPERLRSEAAWAHLCAAAPIPASSGKTKRHRLNPAGDRQANHALWRIVITRMSAHPATRAYVQRRTAEGLSKKEIIRCPKRYVAREVYPHLRAAAD